MSTCGKVKSISGTPPTHDIISGNEIVSGSEARAPVIVGDSNGAWTQDPVLFRVRFMQIDFLCGVWDTTQLIWPK